MKRKRPFQTKDGDFVVTRWSKNNPKTCVAVAIKSAGVAVRNSNDPHKDTVYFTRDEWAAFVRGVKDGEFSV